MCKTSFIIPSYNSSRTIGRTLESIFALNASDSIQEVIVVDCSDDFKTTQILKSYHQPKFTLIELGQKAPPATVRNTGAAMASGDILCFIDSDVFLDNCWLDQVLLAYESGCRAGGGSIGIPDFQRKNFLALAQLYLQFNETLQTGKTRPISMVPACNMFVERQLFQQAGGFPQLRAAEDVLFCLKCLPKGSVWFVPEAHCFHIFRNEKEAYFQNQIVLGKYILIYRRLFYKKWYYTQPWSALFLPFFLLVKTAKITARIMNASRNDKTKFILSFPLFIAGLFYWAVGFYRGCWQSNISLEN